MRSIRADLLLPGALVAAAIALLAQGMGCAQPLADPIPAAHPSDETPRRGGTLRLASIGEARSVDPATVSEGLGVSLVQLMFDGLVDFDREKRVVPSLAERWELMDDGATYRFVLREGVRFQDGAELTADDVARSIERALHPSTPNPNRSWFASIVGFDDFVGGKRDHLDGVTVEGKYVVTIRLARTDATFLAKLATHVLRPVCKSGGARFANDWLPCGAGPFKLEAGGWAHGASITVVRNDGYWRAGLPHLDAVTWLFNVKIIAQRFKFEAGDIDIFRDMSSADLSRLRADPRWASLGEADPDLQIIGDAMNTRMPPFDNVEVRRAVASAIDRKHYALVRPSNMTPASQPIPPDVPGYNPSLAGQRYDYAAALEHMRRAGFAYDPATRSGGYPAVVPYLVYQGGLAEYLGQIAQQELAKIGIRIELRLLSYPAYIATAHKPDGASMAFWQYGADYADAASFLEPSFASPELAAEDSNNISFYTNPALDQRLARARSTIDPAERQTLLDQATQIVCDDAPWAFTIFWHGYEARQPYVRGYKRHPIFTSYVRDAWLDRSRAALARNDGARDAMSRALALLVPARGKASGR